MAFRPDVRTKVLLWCDRHCCLCKKQCGVNIEVHHIEPNLKKGRDDLDNAMPLCFDCHAKVKQYDAEHPRGSKYREQELKVRREQVFEEFTRHLVPPVHYEMKQALLGGGSRQFPDVGFVLSHVGDSLPVRVRVRVELLGKVGNRLVFGSHYSGERLWHLNPRFSIWGHFEIPKEGQKQEALRLRVGVTVIDQYDREHLHLPVEYAYVREPNYWYLDPSRDGG